MSDLLGAWSPAGFPARAALGPDCVQAMRAHLPGAAAGLAEIDRGPLWLMAAKSKLFESDTVCAYEGYIPEGDLRIPFLPAALGSIDVAGEWRRAPEGHYVLVCADPAGRSLALLRALSGGERLYVLRTGGLVLFSSALRPLLAHPRVARRLNRERMREAILTGLTLSGSDTLIAGIEEVPAGHVLHLAGQRSSLRWHYEGLLEPIEGEPTALARRYRDALGAAVARSAGATRPVAVTLSGGIDSAAITALAVEAFGADAVHAYTYEFDDPTHPSETPYAVETCRRLGIRHHHVFRIALDEFLAAIPETVWRAESFVHWPKAFMLLAARHIRDAGHDRFLSGFGIGSHMAYYEDLARVLEWIPTAALAAYWNLARAPRLHWLGGLERLHPGLAAPNLRVLYFLLSLFRARGASGDPLRSYPAGLAALLAGLPDCSGPDPAFRDMAPADLLRHQSFAHLVSCIDVTRWEKPLREIGTYRISPAHYASTIPYAYLAYRQRPFVWSAARRLRPGKHLLRLAMQGRLPESVIYRKKSWADAVISPAWLAAGTRWMRSVVPDYWRVVDTAAEGCRAALASWDARSPQTAVTALAFWNRIFIERAPSTQPPTWLDLLTSDERDGNLAQSIAGAPAAA